MAPGHGLNTQTEMSGKSQHVTLYTKGMQLTSKGEHHPSAIDPVPVCSSGSKDVAVAA